VDKIVLFLCVDLQSSALKIKYIILLISDSSKATYPSLGMLYHIYSLCVAQVEYVDEHQCEEGAIRGSTFRTSASNAPSLCNEVAI
jgi:hypothetical protein